MVAYFRSIGAVLLLMSLSLSCGTAVSTGINPGDYAKMLDSLRRDKDNAFAMGKHSPFSEVREEFTGLKYYAADTAYRLHASWIQPDTTYLREISDSKGGIRKYRFSGFFNFTMNGRNFSLPVWSEDEYPDQFFIMFRDRTNGKETYGGGRYIEMNKPVKGQEIILDFNMAFNPYCHYNKNYSCPLVPPDHSLDTEIKAGEKLYSK